MEVDSKIWYRPTQIVKHKLITTSKGDCYYNFVLDEINAKRLKAENRGKGKTPYFWVLGKDILEYRKKNNLFIEPKEVATPVAV